MRLQPFIPIIAVVYIMTFFTFASGVLNGILEGKSALFITRQRNIQTLGEVVLGVSIFLAGTTSFYIIHKAGEGRTNINKLTILGFSILTLTLIAGYALIIIKF